MQQFLIYWWQNGTISSTIIQLHISLELLNDSCALWWAFILNNRGEKRDRAAQHQFQLMAYYTVGTSGSTTNMCTHERFCFPQGPEYWEMFSHYCIYMHASEHVLMDLFPRYFTTPIRANAQSPEAKQSQGVGGVKCLTGGCSVSLCLSHFI